MITIDRVGTLYDENMDPLTGYHVNVSLEGLPPELALYQIWPANPKRVFAGDEYPYTLTAFLRFDTEEEADGILQPFVQ